MEFCDEENLEVFAVGEENGRDGASDDEEPVPMSEDQRRRRRVSDMIDSMGDGDNIFPASFTTPRRASNRSTDLTSPDQGFSESSEKTTPECVKMLMPDWLNKKPDLVDAGLSRLPVDDDLPNSPLGITAKMSVEMDADCYNMNHQYRGKCVIFNHETFDIGFDERVGSSVDAKRIEQTFEKLGFTVEVLDNLEHSQVMDKLSELSEEDHEDADCMCIFVLTHGMSNDMICAKDVAYKADKIWKPFTADKCRSLAGKPKLFFFQACRGKELDDGVTMMRSAVRRSETDSIDTSYKIPTHADFLIAHSSVQGFYSWRNPTEGTWFVQCLCEVLDAYADKTDLLKMMTITARKIATTRASYHDLNPYKHDKKQVPSITSMLLRDVYFTSKQ